MAEARFDDAQPWLRWLREGERPYAAFVTYRDLGDERGLQRVADELAVSRTLISRWSAQWQWVARALAWDHAQRRAQDAAAAAARERLTQQHHGVASQLLVAALELLRHPADERPKSADVAAAATAIEKAIQQQRLATGLPSDVTRQDVALRANADEVLAMARAVRRVIEEMVCDECRTRIADELGRLEAHQRALAARL
jgi:hypothetical protein